MLSLLTNHKSDEINDNLSLICKFMNFVLILWTWIRINVTLKVIN